MKGHPCHLSLLPLLPPPSLYLSLSSLSLKICFHFLFLFILFFFFLWFLSVSFLSLSLSDISFLFLFLLYFFSISLCLSFPLVYVFLLSYRLSLPFSLPLSWLPNELVGFKTHCVFSILSLSLSACRSDPLSTSLHLLAFCYLNAVSFVPFSSSY